MQQLEAENNALNEKLKALQKKLDEQYAINNVLHQELGELNKKTKMGHNRDDDDEYYDNNNSEESELEPLSLKIMGNSSSMAASSSSVDLKSRIKGGALEINICKCYKLRIYSHYWLWQIPLLLTNIFLYCLYNIDHSSSSSSSSLPMPPLIALREVSFFAVGPVFLAALLRDKIFSWFIYWSVRHLGSCCCTQYARYHMSRLADCIGGLHSSFGVTALIWNIIYSKDTFIREEYQWNIRTLTGFGLPFLLLIICISAAPCFRYYYHNSFEIIHRYLNWLCLALLLTHIYFINYHIFLHKIEGSKDDKIALLLHMIFNTPSIFAILLLILTVYPWIIIHRIKGNNVEIIPSKSGISAAFIFQIKSPMGAVCKMSTDWVEFHVMGITPLPYDADKGGHRSLVLIKSLGDWTKRLMDRALVSHQQQQQEQEQEEEQQQEEEDEDNSHRNLDDATFWIHRIKPPNFSKGLFNWNRVFALATGAGIAPLIPYVVHPNYYNVKISLLWVARDHGNNYPEFIVDILKPLKNVILYDTTKQKRPDLPSLTVKKAKEFNAEAVFIVSNPKIAYKVANYVHKKGIPVFGSNFDI